MLNRILNKVKLAFFGVILVIILGVVYLLSYNLAEPKAYDFMVKNVLINKLPFDNTKQVYGSDDIVIVIIDAKSVGKYRWPWKRELYCKLMNYFSKKTEAKVVVYDSIINTLDIDNPESDAKYFSCVKNMKNFVSGVFFVPDYWENEEFGARYDKKFTEKFAAPVEDNMRPVETLFNSVLIFPQPYFDVIKNIGSTNIIQGAIDGALDDRANSDQVIRRINPFIKYNNAYIPSLSMKTFMVLNNITKVTLTDDEIIFPEINRKIKQVRTDLQNIVPLKFYKLYEGLFSHKTYSAIDVMNSYDMLERGQKPILDPKLFKDKVVVIGAYVPSGEGLNDVTHTSISVKHPGPDIHAIALDNMMHDDFLKVISKTANLLITIFVMLLVYFAVKKFNLVQSVIAIISVILGYLLASTACFYFDIVINVITPVVMFILTTIFAYTNKYFIENKNKEKVQNAMGKYMSRDVMKRVVENIDNLGLGGKKAVVTVLFADIRGFTSISEKLPAQQVSEILNEYFSEMEPIITRYNGIINKFIGDAILAVFGEPIQDENHAQNAVKCAYAMLQRVKQLHKKWAREGKPEIEIGIGINTGEVFVGNIGSNERMEYTVIGDTVNLASRLESYNKAYKTKMLISTTTYKHVRKIADVIKIPEVQIRGKAHKIDIYEVLKVKLD